jgi:hypothetical protein
VDPKWFIVWIQVVVRRGCSDMSDVVIGRLGLSPRHLGSFLGVIELNVWCAFVRKARYFDVQIKEILLYK